MGKGKKYAVVAGKEVIEISLTLYYCLRDSDTPAWAKTIIFSTLGYFIFPADAIPDFVPDTCYTDDLGVLLLALAVVAAHVKPGHKAKAQEKMKVWLGE